MKQHERRGTNEKQRTRETTEKREQWKQNTHHNNNNYIDTNHPALAIVAGKTTESEIQMNVLTLA